jgi:type IV pilus assembly protein PilB
MGRRRIGEIMVDEGFITDEQLEQALKDQKKGIERLGETVIRLNFITRIQRDEIVKIQMEEMAG